MTLFSEYRNELAFCDGISDIGEALMIIAKTYAKSKGIEE